MAVASSPVGAELLRFRGSIAACARDHISVTHAGYRPPRLLRRQRRLPLPRTGVRRAPLRPRRRARRRLAADRCGRAVFALWRRPWRCSDGSTSAAGDGRSLRGARARRDERLLLPGDRPAAARHGRRDRVPAGDRAGGARDADAPHAARRSRSRSAASRRSPASGSRASRSASRSPWRTPFSSRSTSCSDTASRRASRSAASTAWPRRCSSRSSS